MLEARAQRGQLARQCCGDFQGMDELSVLGDFPAPASFKQGVKLAAPGGFRGRQLRLLRPMVEF